MLLSRRQAAVLLVGGAAASLAAACQSPAQPATPTAVNPLIKPRGTGAELTAVQASSELAVGRNRFAVGLIDARNQPITTGRAGFEFFKLRTDGTAEKRSDAPATFRMVGNPSKGIWVSQTEFNEAGAWGAQVSHEPAPNEAPRVARMNFEVLQEFSAPGYDEPAPRSVTPTVNDVGGDVARLCSNRPPCALHAISIDAAIQAGDKPLVVVFATPALCTSAVCGPELESVLQLHTTYAERVNFVHVEIYEYPFDGQRVVNTVAEWRLPSEPWTFVIDKGGIVRDRFEGSAPVEELEPAVRAVLA